jgi:hypothetical protein
MRKILLQLGLLAGLVAMLGAQDFTQTVTPAERAAAGLDKLSPAELAQLKALVERYKTGEVAVVQQQAQAQVAVHEAKAAEAQQKAAAAEAKAKAAEGSHTDPKKGPSWLAALITLEKTAKSPESNEEFRTRLKGKLESFSGKRSFTLENGQVWQMVDATSWSGPDYDNPEVNIKPGVFGVFWLRVPEASLRVKVKPLKLE